MGVTKEQQAFFSSGEVSARLTMAGVMLESAQDHAARVGNALFAAKVQRVYDAYNDVISETQLLPGHSK